MAGFENALEGALKDAQILKATISMYERTIEEMKKNGAAEESINGIKKELEDTVKKLTKIIDIESYKELKKEEVANELISENVNVSGFELSKSEKKEQGVGKEKQTYSNIIDEMSVAKWIKKCNFYVEFPEHILIKPYRVKNVKVAYSTVGWLRNIVDAYVSGDLYLEIYDFMDEYEDKFISLPKIMFDLANGEKRIGDIRINTLDSAQNILYTTVYKDCILNGFGHNELEYDTDELNTYKLTFSFNAVEIVKE